MNWDLLLAALIMVESGGNPIAVGDDGDAQGCLQIHQVVLTDVNVIHAATYSTDDTFDPTTAREICRKYLTHYIGELGTAEEYARTWNGGPRGMEKESTISYWEKVRAEMEQLAKKEALHVQN